MGIVKKSKGEVRKLRMHFLFSLIPMHRIVHARPTLSSFPVMTVTIHSVSIIQPSILLLHHDYHQASHFCPPIAHNRLNNSSLNGHAVTTHLFPLRSTISSPSCTTVSILHPTTSFAFHPYPPNFFSSRISPTGTDHTGCKSSSSRFCDPSFSILLSVEKATHGSPALVVR